MESATLSMIIHHDELAELLQTTGQIGRFIYIRRYKGLQAKLNQRKTSRLALTSEEPSRFLKHEPGTDLLFEFSKPKLEWKGLTLFFTWSITQTGYHTMPKGNLPAIRNQCFAMKGVNLLLPTAKRVIRQYAKRREPR